MIVNYYPHSISIRIIIIPFLSPLSRILMSSISARFPSYNDNPNNNKGNADQIIRFRGNPRGLIFLLKYFFVSLTIVGKLKFNNPQCLFLEALGIKWAKIEDLFYYQIGYYQPVLLLNRSFEANSSQARCIDYTPGFFCYIQKYFFSTATRHCGHWS